MDERQDSRGTRVGARTAGSTRILTVCPFVPHPQLPHAGGQYLYAHMTALQQWYDCEMIVPDTAENRAAYEDGGDVFHPQLVPAMAWTHLGGLTAVVGKISGILRPVLPDARFATAIARAVAARLPEVDVVELQWPEYVGLLPGIRRLAPGLPVVVVEHDVLSQRVLRDTKLAATRRSRLSASAKARRVAQLEKQHLDQANRVVVFSEKDSQLLRKGGVVSPIEVLLPPLEDDGMLGAELKPVGEESRILFVAAFDRVVNDAGARWFIQKVFPRVREALPAAVLVLAGAKVRDGLRTLAEEAPGVEMTGFVPDLGEVYRAADLAVVPLLTGAGLKFKVAAAMMWGLPVVSTTVGAEGYPADDGLFAGVEDEPDRFADAVIRSLTDRVEARARAETGRAWATSTFSQQTFENHLRAIYEAPDIAPVVVPT